MAGEVRSDTSTSLLALFVSEILPSGFFVTGEEEELGILVVGFVTKFTTKWITKFVASLNFSSNYPPYLSPNTTIH